MTRPVTEGAHPAHLVEMRLNHDPEALDDSRVEGRVDAPTDSQVPGMHDQLSEPEP